VGNITKDSIVVASNPDAIDIDGMGDEE